MSTDTLVPEIGQIVAVRQRLYLVDRVIPPPNPSDSLLVRLSCVDDDAQGQALARIIHEFADKRKPPLLQTC